MKLLIGAALALTLAAAAPAEAQIIFTEIQPNLIGLDDGEWFELQNVGTSSVNIGGWTISDFTGGNEAAPRWTFPATATVAAGQVIVVTKQSARFRAVFPAVTPDYELADGMDDPAVPNLPRTGMGDFALGNGGDGLVIRDAMGALVEGIEYGNMDIASIPGLPYPNIPNPNAMDNRSITRVMRTGSSAVDYSDRFVASPGVGFMSLAGPQLTNLRARPRHVNFNDMYTITASITSAEPVTNAEVYFTIATSSAGPATGPYLAVELEPVVGSSLAYSYSANIESFATGRGFGSPSTFHEVYARWFVRVSDAVGNVTTEPSGAVEDAAGAIFLPAYTQNVMPQGASPIAAVREEAATLDGPRWRNHSVRVTGVILVGPNVINPGRLQFAIQDGSGKAIAVFDNNADVTSFNFVPGQIATVTGTLNGFRKLTQIGANTRVQIGAGVERVPTSTHTIGQIVAMGNDLESQLVTIIDARFAGATPATWPSDAMNAGSWNLNVTDGTGEIQVRVTPGAIGLFGAAAPQHGFHITGLLQQRDDVWQLFPRSAADVIAKPMPIEPDAGVADAAPGADAAPRADASVRADGGTTVVTPPPADEGCSCSSASEPSRGIWALALLVGLAMWRRRA